MAALTDGYQQNKRLGSLQFLRGIAVLLVLLAHSIDYSEVLGHSVIASFCYLENFGAIGVDIFFVISGTIMTIIISNSKIGPLVFLKKRCIRILPLYWFVSIFFFIDRIFLRHQSIDKVMFWKTVTILPIADNQSFVAPVVSVGWTLSFEFLFYIIIAFCLFFKKINTAFLSGIILSILIVIGVLFPTIKNVQFVFVTNPIIIEFLLGCLGGWLFVSNIKIRTYFVYGILLVGIFIFITNIVFGYGKIDFMENTIGATMSLERVVKWGIGSFCITAGLLLLEKAKRFKVNRLFMVIGDISYSIYLTHIILLSIILICWKKTGFKHPDLFIVACIAICMVAAYFVHLFIEKPLILFFNKSFFKNKPDRS